MSCALEKIVVVEVSKHLQPCLQPLKTLYLYYRNAYGQQTWQEDDLP